MGYSTDFFGSFDLTPPLTAAQVEELETFNEERHDGSGGFDSHNRAGELVRLPQVKGHGAWGSGVWCQWVPVPDGLSGGSAVLAWDGGEKFYDYVPWLVFLIERFFKPWGVTVSGDVRWQGEETDDAGVIRVEGNVVSTAPLTLAEGEFTAAEAY